MDLPNGQGDLVEKIVSSDSSFKLRTYSFDMPPDDENEQVVLYLYNFLLVDLRQVALIVKWSLIFKED